MPGRGPRPVPRAPVDEERSTDAGAGVDHHGAPRTATRAPPRLAHPVGQHVVVRRDRQPEPFDETVDDGSPHPVTDRESDPRCADPTHHSHCQSRR